jgi:hypothetical protein
MTPSVRRRRAARPTGRPWHGSCAAQRGELHWQGSSDTPAVVFGLPPFLGRRAIPGVLGIVPFTGSVKIVPAGGFWALDDPLMVADDWHAAMWWDDADNINRARRTLNPR